MSRVDNIRARLRTVVGVYGTAPAAGEAWGHVAHLLGEVERLTAERLVFEQALVDIVNAAWTDGEMAAVGRARKALATRGKP